MRSGQILQFPLSRGLAEDDNAKAKPLASLKSGVNIRWPRSGVIGKRYGATQRGDAVTGIRRFVPRGDELGATDGEQMIVYDSVLGTWTETGRLVSEVALEWSTIQDDSEGMASSDIAISGDLLVHAWVSGDPTRDPRAWPRLPGGGAQAFVQILNWRTGQVVLPPTAIVSGVAATNDRYRFVRVLVASTYAFVIHSFDNTIRSQPINLTTRALGTQQTLKSDLRGTIGTYFGRFDARFLASGSLALVYESTTPNITASRFTRSADSLTVAATSTTTGLKMRALRIIEDVTASRLYIVHGIDGDDINAKVQVRAVHNSTMASALSAADLIANFRASHIGLSLVSTGVLACVISGSDYVEQNNLDLTTYNLGLPRLVSFHVNSAGAKIADTYGHATNLCLLSDFFVLDSKRYVFASDARYGEPTYFEGDGSDLPHVAARLDDPGAVSSYLLEILGGAFGDWGGIPPRYVGKIDHDVSGIFQHGFTPQVAAVDSSTMLAILPFQATAAQTSYNWRCGVRLVQATIDPDLMPNPWRSVVIGREAYLTGGLLGAWDGRAVFDYGMRVPFVHRAETGLGYLNGEMEDGVYVYQFEPGYRSHAGVLHRGPLSVQATATVNGAAANGVVLWTLGTHGIDGKQTEEGGYGPTGPGVAHIDVFRSEADGATVHRLTYEPRFNVLANEPEDALMQFEDPKPDTDITSVTALEDDPLLPTLALSTRPQPYTSDGSLEDCQPPAPYSVHLHNGRIFTITGSRREVWYSQDYRENPGIAPGFNVALSELYDVDLVAMASLDARRILFHETGILFVDGDGPNVTGLDNRFSTPQPIQTDVGCTNPRSIVSWPNGVIFQSGSDLYNLDRGLSVSWLGKDARDTLASYPAITSAVLVADQNEIRFTCNNAAGSAGIVLVFDYVRGTWSTRTYASGAAIRDAVLHGGFWYFATAAAVYYEDTTTHLDAGVFVPSTVELETISPAGPVGWQRVRIVKPIGQSLSNHALTIYASRDWSASYEQSESFAAGSAVTTVGPYERAEVALTVPRRQAVGLKFVDAAPANTTTHPLGNGAGFQLEGVALLVQPQPGMPRDTTTRRGG